MAQRVAGPTEINGAPVDRFTLAHGAFGFAMGWTGQSFARTLVIGVGWEIAERVLKDKWPGLFPNPTQDTLENAALDVAAVLGGWKAAQWAKRRA